MKVTRDVKFIPVTVVFESQAELDLVVALCGSCTSKVERLILGVEGNNGVASTVYKNLHPYTDTSKPFPQIRLEPREQ